MNSIREPEEIFKDLSVGVYHDFKANYPNDPPFHPETRYPEYCLNGISKENRVYAAVREAFLLLGLDRDNFGTAAWNPLGAIVQPGETVVLKPNFVISRHEAGGNLFSIITHPAVIRAVVDYVFIALKGRGSIIIADAPDMSCNFEELLKKTGLNNIKECYKNQKSFNIQIVDLRNFWLDVVGRPEAAYYRNRRSLPGDPAGSLLINLSRESKFYGVPNAQKLYGADYDRKETIKHHHDDIHEYLFSKTIMSADVVILLPKLKVHKKVGVSLNIKGLVGCCVDKNYLVHFTIGTPSEGGDQFPEVVFTRTLDTWLLKLKRLAQDIILARKLLITDLFYKYLRKSIKFLLKILKLKRKNDYKICDNGNWFGNDSTWRMVVDLYKIFVFSDKNGMIGEKPRRKIFTLIDGIIGGENNGPLEPDSKRCGLILTGFNPAAVDLVATRLMGFNYNNIKIFNAILNQPENFFVQVGKIKVYSNENYNGLFNQENFQRYFNFVHHHGWRGHIEIKNA